MTKIVICGANGKMGHTVASCIDGQDDCTVIGGVDSYTAKYADFPIVATPAELPEVPDVIIDFSNPSTLDELLEYALVNNVALVLATTGYDDAQIQKIQSASQQTWKHIKRICAKRSSTKPSSSIGSTTTSRRITR